MRELLEDLLGFLRGDNPPRGNAPYGCAFVFAWLFIGVMCAAAFFAMLNHFVTTFVQ
jgi:hypothetical protein